MLFVHGIGEQKQGTTLISYADPIVEVLNRFLTKDQATLRAHDAELGEALEASTRSNADGSTKKHYQDLRRLYHLPEEPAPVRVARLATEPGGPPAQSDVAISLEGTSTTWRLSESWWARDLFSPSNRTLFSWVFSVVPTLLVQHSSRRIVRFILFSKKLWLEPAEPWRWVRRSFVVLAWLWFVCMTVVLVPLLWLISLLIGPMLLLLLVLTWLPIPGVSRAVRWIGGRLVASVGDSYVLTASPTQFGAMVTRVTDDIERLADQCEVVAVVAHSQGAVIAHEALRRMAPGSVGLFCTVGAGLSKLAELRRTAIRRESTGRIIYGFHALMLSLGGLMAVATGQGVVLLGVAALDLLLLAIVFVVVDDPAKDQRILSELKVESLTASTWKDFYASADLIPYGPMTDQPVDWVDSRRVVNRASWLSDHTSYNRNLDGFVMRLVFELARVSASADPGAISLRRHLKRRRADVLSAERRRNLRLRALFAARSIVVILTILAVWTRWEWFRARGADVVNAGYSDWFVSAMKVITKPLAALDIPGFSLGWWMAVMVVSLAASASGYVVRIGWQAWERGDVRSFFRDETPSAFRWPFLGFVTAIIAVTAVAVFFVLRIDVDRSAEKIFGALAGLELGFFVVWFWLGRQLRPGGLDWDRQKRFDKDVAVSALLACTWSLPFVYLQSPSRQGSYLDIDYRAGSITMGAVLGLFVVISVGVGYALRRSTHYRVDAT